LELWPENNAAKKEVSKATLLYAQCALEKGDLDLAESLLDKDDPDTLDLLNQLDAVMQKQADRQNKLKLLTRERRTREKRLKALYRLCLAVAGIAILVLVGAIYWVYEEHKQAESELNKRLQLEEENQQELKNMQELAASKISQGRNALRKSSQTTELYMREKLLIKAQTAFRKAWFLKPDSLSARNGFQKASLKHFYLALKQQNWRQAREKLEQAREAGMPEAFHKRKEIQLEQAGKAQKKYIQKRVKELLVDAANAQREVSHEMALLELVSLTDPMAVELLITSLKPNRKASGKLVLCHENTRLLAIQSLAWMRDKRAVHWILPYVKEQAYGHDNPKNLQEAAIITICLLMPDDRKAYEIVSKRIAEEADDFHSALYKRVKGYFEHWGDNMEQQ